MRANSETKASPSASLPPAVEAKGPAQQENMARPLPGKTMAESKAKSAPLLDKTNTARAPLSSRPALLLSANLKSPSPKSAPLPSANLKSPLARKDHRQSQQLVQEGQCIHFAPDGSIIKFESRTEADLYAVRGALKEALRENQQVPTNPHCTLTHFHGNLQLHDKVKRLFEENETLRGENGTLREFKLLYEATVGVNQDIGVETE